MELRIDNRTSESRKFDRYYHSSLLINVTCLVSRCFTPKIMIDIATYLLYCC